jgi:glycosyltransferase involved in cell wall biosynthesis
MPPAIAHLVTTFLPVNTTAWVSALMADQLRRGCRVELVVGRHADPGLLEAQRRQGVRVTRIPSLRKYLHPVNDLQALAALYRLLGRLKVDMVHTHLAKAGVLGRLAAFRAGVPLILHSVYGASFAPTQPWWRFRAFRALERLAGRRTDEFIFVGRELAEAYRRHGACPPDKGVVVYYGKDLTPFLATPRLTPEERRARRAARGWPPEALILGNISRLVPWKGHLDGLQVVARLKEAGIPVRYVIVGDAKTPREQRYKQHLLAEVRRQGLEEEVIFTGWQSEPASFYPLFDFYLLTSMPFEGVPGSVIEAAVCGVPVVGYDCYGLREIPGLHFRLAPHGDTQALADLILEELPHLPGLAARCRPHPAILAQVQERFSLPGMVSATAEVYERLLREKLPSLCWQGSDTAAEAAA